MQKIKKSDRYTIRDTMAIVVVYYGNAMHVRVLT